MRTIRVHGETLPPDRVARVAGLFPGLEGARIWLAMELADVIRTEIAAGVDWRHRVVHIQPDGVTAVDRAAQIALLRRAGVHKLAAELRDAVVRPGYLLAFCDFEGASWTTVSRIRDLTGGGA